MPASTTNRDAKGQPKPPEPLRFPMSYAEQRLWFLEQLEPGKPVYNVTEAIRLTGLLDVEALERAIHEIARRHECLRTTFALVDGLPMQIVAPSLGIPLAAVDLRYLPETERERQAARAASDEAARCFDLEHGPLLRATLFQLNHDEHVLMLVMHHIVSEGGWSMSVFLREMGILYNAYRSGRTSPLPELAIQYGDYAVWQRDSLQGAVLEPHLSYWKAQLDGAPAVIDWPADRQRPPEQTYAGAHQEIWFPKDLSDALDALSRKQGSTLFTTLLAAFQTLLFRHTGQEDLVVGAPVAGRTPQTEDLIGLFLNTIPLRSHLSGQVSFRELMQQARQIVLGGLAHQELPFEVLVEALRPERSLAFTPVFQVMFAFQNAPRQELGLSGLVVKPFEVEIRSSMFDLTLFAWPKRDGLRIVFEYSTDLFDRATIERMQAHFQVLVEGIVKNPDEQLCKLPLLTEGERSQLVAGWNETQKEYPQDQCIHHLFEAQVRRTPDHTAVFFGDGRLTYGELNRRANQLAHHLRALGVGPDGLVGICVERSLEMVIGILGVLKAGGAFVPLDPDYPQERLEFMVNDAHLTVLLTQPEVAAALPLPAVHIIQLIPDWQTFAPYPCVDPIRSCTPENLAYVIYTSGSTGRPKGVMIEHSSLVNCIHSFCQEIGIESRDRFLSVTTMSFDIFYLEIFAPLVRGAAVVVAKKMTTTDSERLAQQIKASGATIMQATPSSWRLLVAGGWRGNRNLRCICGGEALSPDLALELMGRCGQLWNVYGPTETTIWSTVFPFPGASAEVLIGRPIANTQVYLLDEYLQPAPVGISGELYIGGAGLARGYLNLPELTADRFIANPFEQRPGSRLYKTGDLARYRSNGNIEYLGRTDQQVKVRGFRIELGEIETVLSQHPSIRECAVAAREFATGDKRLVGYLVASGSARPSASELRTLLQGKLPEYMVPSAFVYLSALPMTPNGKVDRRTLPAPSGDRPDTGDMFVAPRDDVQKVLAGIWGQILGVNRLGIHDNFFDLGGHSLLAVRLFMEIERVFNVRLPMATLFQAQTIEEFSVLLRSGTASSWSPLVTIQPNGLRPPFFCVHGAGGNVLIYLGLSRRLGPEQPFFGLQCQGLGGHQPPLERIEDMATLYVKEIRRVQTHGPYFLGGYCLGGLVALEMAQRLRREGEEVALVALLDTINRLNIGPERLWHKTSYQVERLIFHLRNFALLNCHEKVEFLGEKLSVVRSRVPVWCGMLLGKVAAKHPTKQSESLQLARIWETNDRAVLDYTPRPYGGMIIEFRPTQQYAKFNQSRCSWKELALGGYKAVTLPVYPAGMLLEPFVKHLAEVLGASIDAAIEATNAPKDSSESVA